MKYILAIAALLFGMLAFRGGPVCGLLSVLCYIMAAALYDNGGLK